MEPTYNIIFDFNDIMLKFYNTLTRRKEIFKPLKNKRVGFYTCGPTVYNYAHIGNLRTYIFEDLLKRTLLFNKYKVKHVMNITDVGHLVSDADDGEDKMMIALKREKQKPSVTGMLALAKKYTKSFQQNLQDLNISEPDVWCKATEHIPEMIKIIKQIIKNGYTYETDEALYFNTNKLKEYGELAGLNLEQSENFCSRIGVKQGKKHPADFVLWFKAKGDKAKHVMQWNSPWGNGWPGWHIECSAMSIKYLGKQFDLHTGGIDLASVHHTNERAQNISAIGKPVVKYWLHGEFLIINKKRMGKSQDNFITLDTVKQKKINPLAYRYFCLSAHYRQKLNFSWEALMNAQAGLNNLTQTFVKLGDKQDKSDTKIIKKFIKFINDDLNIPQAMALLWITLKSKKLTNKVKKATILELDKVFGLGLAKLKTTKIPATIKQLVAQREKARQDKDWAKSDKLRKLIEKEGFVVEDTPEGAKIRTK